METKGFGASSDARLIANGGISDNNVEHLTLPPFVGGSPTFTGGITDRSCVSRIGKKSLREVSFSDADLEPAANEVKQSKVQQIIKSWKDFWKRDSF